MVKYLLVKDRMGVIELLPSDRIRPLVARDFDWLPDGPIRAYFMDHALGDFLGSRFCEGHETMEFAQGLVTEPALTQLRQELRRLRARRPHCTRSQRQRLSSSDEESRADASAQALGARKLQAAAPFGERSIAINFRPKGPLQGEVRIAST